MGLLKGKASFVTFKVLGDLPEGDYVGFILDRLRANAFTDIDDTFDEASVGWVDIEDMFSAEFTWAINSNYMTVAMRIDERIVPGAVLKKYVAKEEMRVKAERQVPRLSRATRLDIKERVRVDLVRKAKPAPKVVEVVWDINSMTLTIFSTSAKLVGYVEMFFHETFQLPLEAVAAEDDLNIRVDFLTWLFVAFLKNGSPTIDQIKDVVVEGDEISVKCSVDGLASCREAITALQNPAVAGVSKLTIALENGYQYTIAAKDFAVSGVTVPQVTKDGEGEQLELGGEILDRVSLMQFVADDLADRYERFVEQRDAAEIGETIDWLASELSA
jgi:DNA recombination-dependent growth factor C